jgi:hypothetical protein
MQILENEHERPLLRERLQEAAPRRERFAGGGCALLLSLDARQRT